MRVSLLSKVSTRKTPSLATLFPTLFALTSSTVQVQCFASSTFAASTVQKAYAPHPAAFVRGGSVPKKSCRGLFSTTEKSSSTAADTTTTAATEMAGKLESLRARMKELGMDVYLIPSDDPHLSGKLENALFLLSC